MCFYIMFASNHHFQKILTCMIIISTADDGSRKVVLLALSINFVQNTSRSFTQFTDDKTTLEEWVHIDASPLTK
jgi:hypothetical protein